jgi:hypothetical protein
MEVEASHLKAMGLHSKRGALDEYLGFSKWTQKRNLHTKVKAQTGTTDKPDAEEWFRHEKGNTNTNAVRCNVSLCCCYSSLVVVKGNPVVVYKRKRIKWNSTHSNEIFWYYFIKDNRVTLDNHQRRVATAADSSRCWREEAKNKRIRSNYRSEVNVSNSYVIVIYLQQQQYKINVIKYK